MKKVVVKALVENLDTVLELLNSELELCGFPEEHIPVINVAVEEIFVNICDYAFEADAGDILFAMSANAEEAVFQFEDRGKPFNPLHVPEPDLDKPISERDIGGLGIHFVRQIMDELEYRYEAETNVLIMKKKGVI